MLKMVRCTGSMSACAPVKRPTRGVWLESARGMYFIAVGVPTKKAAANTPALSRLSQHGAARSGS